MKNIKLPILAIIMILISFSSCKKKEGNQNNFKLKNQPEYNPLSGIFTDDECIAVFTLLSQKAYLPSNPSLIDPLRSFRGAISSPFFGAYKPVNRDGGDFYINATMVSKTDDSLYREENFSNAASFFGTTPTFYLTGNSANGIDSFIRDMYIPEEIEMSSPDSLVLSKSSSTNTISWNTDPNYNGDVYIRILYKGGLSNQFDSTLSTTDIIYNDQVSDNGTYLIPSSVFSSMPINGMVEIMIGRGNYVSINKNNKYFYVTASTITYQIFKLAP